MNKLVYLFELDSVRNTDEQMELAMKALFREILINGNAVAITYNQLIDSRFFLSLMNDDKWSDCITKLFQLGAIRISQFGMYRTPSQYLIGQALNSTEEYIFSGLPLKSCQKSLIALAKRSLMYSDLTELNEYISGKRTEEERKLLFREYRKVKRAGKEFFSICDADPAVDMTNTLNDLYATLKLVLRLSDIEDAYNLPKVSNDTQIWPDLKSYLKCVINFVGLKGYDEWNETKKLLKAILNGKYDNVFKDRFNKEFNKNKRSDILKFLYCEHENLVNTQGKSDKRFREYALAQAIVDLCYNYTCEASVNNVSRHYDLNALTVFSFLTEKTTELLGNLEDLGKKSNSSCFDRLKYFLMYLAEITTKFLGVLVNENYSSDVNVLKELFTHLSKKDNPTNCNEAQVLLTDFKDKATKCLNGFANNAGIFTKLEGLLTNIIDQTDKYLNNLQNVTSYSDTLKGWSTELAEKMIIFLEGLANRNIFGSSNTSKELLRDFTNTETLNRLIGFVTQSKAIVIPSFNDLFEKYCYTFEADFISHLKLYYGNKKNLKELKKFFLVPEKNDFIPYHFRKCRVYNLERATNLTELVSNCPREKTIDNQLLPYERNLCSQKIKQCLVFLGLGFLNLFILGLYLLLAFYIEEWFVGTLLRSILEKYVPFILQFIDWSEHEIIVKFVVAVVIAELLSPAVNHLIYGIFSGEIKKEFAHFLVFLANILRRFPRVLNQFTLKSNNIDRKLGKYSHWFKYLSNKLTSFSKSVYNDSDDYTRKDNQINSKAENHCVYLKWFFNKLANIPSFSKCLANFVSRVLDVLCVIVSIVCVIVSSVAPCVFRLVPYVNKKNRKTKPTRREEVRLINYVPENILAYKKYKEVKANHWMFSNSNTPSSLSILGGDKQLPDEEYVRLARIEELTGKEYGIAYSSSYHKMVVDPLVKNSTCSNQSDNDVYPYERLAPASDKSGVVTVPIIKDKDGNTLFVLIKQYRHAIRREQLCFPRGFGEKDITTKLVLSATDESVFNKLSGEDKEEMVDFYNAQKELHEEIGAVLLGSNETGKSPQQIKCVTIAEQEKNLSVSLDVTDNPKPALTTLGKITPDSGSLCDTVRVIQANLDSYQEQNGHEGIIGIEDPITADQLEGKINNGEIDDGFTIAAFLLWKLKNQNNLGGNSNP